jgi:hypothetical protein
VFANPRRRKGAGTIARIQYIHRYPTWYATKPMIKGASGTPKVSITVHIPMYFALSCLKNDSTTTALPMAEAGQMKNAANARHVAIAVYVFVIAQPTLKSRLPTREMRKMGRRPKRVDSGRQKSGAPPMMAI